MSRYFEVDIMPFPRSAFWPEEGEARGSRERKRIYRRVRESQRKRDYQIVKEIEKEELRDSKTERE